MGWSPLHLAAMEGHVGLIETLVSKHGCSITARSANSWTPLHYAAAHNRVCACAAPEQGQSECARVALVTKNWGSGSRLQAGDWTLTTSMTDIFLEDYWRSNRWTWMGGQRHGFGGRDSRR